MINEDTTKSENKKQENLAKDWIKSGKGRPPSSIASKVREFSKKETNRKEVAKRAIVRADKKLTKEEVKEAKKAQKEIAIVKRKEEFLESFIRNDGNLTKVGLEMFNTTNRMSASQMAGGFMRKNQAAMRVYLEEKGYNLGWLLELLAKKTEESKNADFMDRLFRLMGYGELQPPKKAPQTFININKTNEKLAEEYGFEEGEVIDGEEDNT